MKNWIMFKCNNCKKMFEDSKKHYKEIKKGSCLIHAEIEIKVLCCDCFWSNYD